MRRPRVIGLAAAALAAGLLVGSTAYVDAQQPQQPAPQEHRLGWLQQKLGLSDEQMAKIRDIHTAQRNAHPNLYRDLRNAQIELRRAALNGADTSKPAADVERLTTALMQARVQTLQQIGSVLTPEQRDAYAKLGPGGGMRHRHAPKQRQA